MSTVEKDPAKGLNAALAATLNGERAAAGLTFDALAARTGISKRTLLRQLSTMERHIDVSHVAVIAEQFGLTAAEVFVMAEARLARTQKGDERSQGA
jgi:transcriptional regulator with XRE-family HTH domain